MITDSLLITDFTKPIYLHHSFTKFWEIKVDAITHRAIIRCGKLVNNEQEDPSKVYTVEKANTSWGEAISYTERSVKMKLERGYEFLESPSQSPSSVSGASLADSLNNLKSENSDSSSISLSKKRRQNDVLTRDDLKQTKKEKERNSDMEEEGGFRRVVEGKKEFEADSKDAGEFVQTAYRLENLTDNEISVISGKAHSLELVCDFVLEKSKVVVTGYQKNIDLFVDYLKTFLEQRKKEEREKKELGEFIQRAFKMEDLTESEKVAILDKAIELELVCEFGKGRIKVIGYEKKTEVFFGFFRKIMTQRKKAEADNQKQMLVPPQVLKSCLKSGRKEHQRSVDISNSPEPEKTKKAKLQDNNSQKMEGDIGEFVQKAFQLENLNQSEKPNISEKAQSLGLLCDFSGAKVIVTGHQRKIDVFVEYLKKFSRRKKGTDQSAKKEVLIEPFMEKMKQEIEKKAEELEVFSEFTESKFIMLGTHGAIARMVAYLFELDIKSSESE